MGVGVVCRRGEGHKAIGHQRLDARKRESREADTKDVHFYRALAKIEAVPKGDELGLGASR